MKTIKQLTTVALIFWSFIIFAQQGINYKAIVKDGGGTIVANQNIDVQFIIYEGPGEINNVYQETHSPSTDANGIVIVNIGQGTTSDDFSAIDWGTDDHYLNVQIDNGGGLTDMGTTQFMAVPYALSVSKETIKIDDLVDGKSDDDGSNDGSSIFFGIGAGINDDGSNNVNVGIGFEALNKNTTGYDNTANGYRALYNNTTGYDNTANGTVALFYNTSGIYNTGTGIAALYNNTTGNANTANGSEALYKNTIGLNNCAFGYRALRSNTEGYNNTAIGTNSLYTNLTGRWNMASGFESLYSNTVGERNTASGFRALYFNASGIHNTATGYYALFNNTANDNTGIGYAALTGVTTGSNNTAIGNDAQVPDGTLDNQVRIGNDAVNYAGVQVAWDITSDKRWKENIRALPYGLEFVKQLNPVDYVRKNNEHLTRETGFIGQDVEALLANIGYTDQGILHKDDKGFISLRYNDFIAILTKAIQEQQAIIEKQNELNSRQSAELEIQKNNYKKLLKRVEQLELANNQ